jgi:hypothetical protein
VLEDGVGKQILDRGAPDDRLQVLQTPNPVVDTTRLRGG